MPDTNGPRNAGQGTFDHEAFMYEVADEIRAGLKEDKKKGQTSGQTTAPRPQETRKPK